LCEGDKVLNFLTQATTHMPSMKSWKTCTLEYTLPLPSKDRLSNIVPTFT
jgi:hypothetical protein